MRPLRRSATTSPAGVVTELSGPLKVAKSPNPSAVPTLALPAMVVTTPSGDTARITFANWPETNNAPFGAIAINRDVCKGKTAFVPTPSCAAPQPQPASVLVEPAGAITRTRQPPASTTKTFPYTSTAESHGKLKSAFVPVPSTLSATPARPASVVTAPLGSTFWTMCPPKSTEKMTPYASTELPVDVSPALVPIPSLRSQQMPVPARIDIAKDGRWKDMSENPSWRPAISAPEGARETLKNSLRPGRDPDQLDVATPAAVIVRIRLSLGM